jgi:hypothetical protein
VPETERLAVLGRGRWGEPQCRSILATCPTLDRAKFATAIGGCCEDGDTLGCSAVPDSWWEGEGITLHELPTTFGTANLRAQRDQTRATVELALTGPVPERITFRYPGAKQARADGRPCDIHGNVISAPNLNRLVIDF